MAKDFEVYPGLVLEAQVMEYSQKGLPTVFAAFFDRRGKPFLMPADYDLLTKPEPHFVLVDNANRKAGNNRIVITSKDVCGNYVGYHARPFDQKEDVILTPEVVGDIERRAKAFQGLEKVMSRIESITDSQTLRTYLSFPQAMLLLKEPAEHFFEWQKYVRKMCCDSVRMRSSFEKIQDHAQKLEDSLSRLLIRQKERNRKIESLAEKMEVQERTDNNVPLAVSLIRDSMKGEWGTQKCEDYARKTNYVIGLYEGKAVALYHHYKLTVPPSAEGDRELSSVMVNAICTDNPFFRKALYVELDAIAVLDKAFCSYFNEKTHFLVFTENDSLLKDVYESLGFRRTARKMKVQTPLELSGITATTASTLAFWDRYDLYWRALHEVKKDDKEKVA